MSCTMASCRRPFLDRITGWPQRSQRTSNATSSWMQCTMTSCRRFNFDHSLIQKIVALVVLNIERDVMPDDFMSIPFDRTPRASAHHPRFNQHSAFLKAQNNRSLKSQLRSSGITSACLCSAFKPLPGQVERYSLKAMLKSKLCSPSSTNVRPLLQRAEESGLKEMTEMQWRHQRSPLLFIQVNSRTR